MILVAEAGGLSSWFAAARLRAAHSRETVVTHRFTLHLKGGTCEVVMRPDPGVTIRCSRGRLWITHDGDPRDVVLEANQSYTAERCDQMTLHAVVDSEMEMAVRRRC